MSDEPRMPQAFILPKRQPDDDLAEAIKVKKKSTPIATVTFDAPELPPVPQLPIEHVPATTSLPWLTILLSGTVSLIMLWASLQTSLLIESWFARSATMGWIATGITSVVALAAVAIIVREIWGFMSLARIEKLQELTAHALNLKDEMSAQSAFNQIKEIFASRPDAATTMQNLRAQEQQVVDALDRLKLADRLIIEPLDAQARKSILKHARQVMMLTAVAPSASLDILIVAALNFRMLKDIARLYGGRPSTGSTLKLARQVAVNLAVAGGLALSDALLQQLVGRGLLGRLSARFGEGAVNGIMTARIGFAACKLCRPVQKTEEDRNAFTSIVKQLMSRENNVA